MVESINRMTRVVRELVQEKGREPSPEEMAEKVEHTRGEGQGHAQDIQGTDIP